MLIVSPSVFSDPTDLSNVTILVSKLLNLRILQFFFQVVDWNEAVAIIDERQLMQVVFSDMSLDHKIDH